MKKVIVIVIVIVQCLALINCDDAKGKKALGKAQGAPYELLVVGDKEWLKTESGSVLSEVLESDIPGLPQSERHFRVMTVNPNGFNKLFQCYRNIIVVNGQRSKVNDSAEDGVGVAHDVYAKGQTIMTITFSDDAEFVRLVEAHKKQILRTFVDKELDRELQHLRSQYSKTVLEQVKKQFGYTAYVPKDINSVKTGQNFMWASSMKRDNMLNFCMYTYPLTAENPLTADNFVAHRNEVMKVNIPGEHEGQFMTTGKMGMESEVVMMKDRQVQQVRGLWEMENDALGGPFVSYAWIDSMAKKVVVAEGFVLAPEKRKRELVGEMEAAVRSVLL